MDDYDPRRLSAFKEGVLTVTEEDVKALVAAHPELSKDDIRKLTETGCSASTLDSDAIAMVRA